MTDANAVTPPSPSGARILISDGDSELRQELRDELSNRGYDIVAEATSGRQAVDLAQRLQPDLSVVDLCEDHVEGLRAAVSIVDGDISPVVLLTNSSMPVDQVIGQVKVAGVVSKPICDGVLVPVIEVALARSREIRWLRQRVAELEDALETRKVVERAKGILMDLHGLSEADAFRRMRKTSMDNRRTMKEVAEAILLSHDLQLGSDLI